MIIFGSIFFHVYKTVVSHSSPENRYTSNTVHRPFLKSSPLAAPVFSFVGSASEFVSIQHWKLLLHQVFYAQQYLCLGSWMSQHYIAEAYLEHSWGYGSEVKCLFCIHEDMSLISSSSSTQSNHKRINRYMKVYIWCKYELSSHECG